MLKGVFVVMLVVAILCGCPPANNESIVEGETGEGEVASEGEPLPAVGDFHLAVLEMRDGGLWEAYLQLTADALRGRWLTTADEEIAVGDIARMGVNIYAQNFGTRLETDEWPITQYGTYFDWVLLGESVLAAEPYVIDSAGRRGHTTDDQLWTYDGRPLVVWHGFIFLTIYGPVTLDEALSGCDWCSVFEDEPEEEGE